MINFTFDNVPPGLARVHVKPSLLAPEYVAVDACGEIVTIHFGNTAVQMHYDAALKISQFIRMKAKEAKRLVGDTSRNWSMLAQIEDAANG